MHDISFKKYEYINSDWIYVKALEGKIEAHDLIFTRYWGCINKPWRTSKIQGFVDINNDQIQINISQASSDDGKTFNGFRPIKINGSYKIITTDKSYEPTEADKSAPCDRAWMSMSDSK